MSSTEILRASWLIPLAFSASWLFEHAEVCAQPTTSQRPTVSWVNPDLPDAPGLTHHVFASQAMGHDVGYVVWAPADFDTSGKTRYRVIYFLHGMGGNETSDSGGFSSLIRRGVRDGILPPTICVFPNGGRSGYRGSVERMIVEELIPRIDEAYPTRADSGSRAVAGFSMGGAGAVWLSVMHPNLFCAAASWGGGMWRGAEAILEATEENADTLRESGFAALLVNGDQDRPDAFQPWAKELAQLGVGHEIVVLKDTSHNLGRYYQLAGDTTTRFFHEQLQGQTANKK